MAVVTGNVFSSEYWASVKPADYKGTELDRALAAWGPLANKKVTIPKDLIPSPPDCKVGKLGSYIDELKGVLKELNTAKELVNKYITVLKAVKGAGNKAAADLTKMFTAKGVSEDAKQKYTAAANAASSMASSAGAALKDYE